MIVDDFKIAQALFELVEAAIPREYEAFQFGIHLQDGYINQAFLLESGGVEYADVNLGLNGAIIYDLVDELKASAAKRGEHWKSFTMSYRHGEQIRINFEY
ncbi:hypothetical protein A7D25_23325 [Pseudomonas sp. 21C1]|uniref:hypothetical protein n=1 Tax=Pseudomonas TaxID=286 RepID=UPI00084AEB58|nr:MULTISPECIES: hypothetical protein [Pseudomonas]OEC32589.1 hypothetical protein A7D25_23325 [Pseudomonas sp. 21C1]